MKENKENFPSPLIRAVIAEDLAAVEQLSRDPQHKLSVDRYGFTAQELAHFLGKRRCVELLCPNESEVSIKIVWPGRAVLQRYHPEGFFQQTGMRWCTQLYFSSYSALGKTVSRCPKALCQQNQGIGQNEKNIQQLLAGSFADVTIVWMGEFMGFGLMTNRALNPGDWVGAYTGEVRPLPFFQADPNNYCLHYPTSWWPPTTYVVDAQSFGNYSRFINHSDQANLSFSCLMYKKLTHFILQANQTIARGSFLTVDYGPNFWARRSNKL